MKRPSRQSDGMYTIAGKKYLHLIGKRKSVWMGTAYKTRGGLTKSGLLMNKWGRIVSKKKHNQQYTKSGKRKQNNLEKKGYFGRSGSERDSKGRFLKWSSSKIRKTMKKRGGLKGGSAAAAAGAEPQVKLNVDPVGFAHPKSGDLQPASL